MNTSFVPSLYHLSSSKLVVSLFNHLNLQESFRRRKYQEIKIQVTEAISHLTPCLPLQRKLEKFIDPLIYEIEDWIKHFEHYWYGFDNFKKAVLETLPYCWLSDGTIDRVKSVKLLVKNEDLRPMNRFILACTYCIIDDVLDLWKILYLVEKAYVRHKSSPFVKHWVEWLDSNSTKEWELFIAYTLSTPFWNCNVYILKHALGMLSSEEKSQHLLKAVVRNEVSTEVMRFCLSAMKKDEQEIIFKEYTVEVFRCILSWPLQSVFYDILDNLWPYITKKAFCSILDMICQQIKNQTRTSIHIIEILQNFWAQSPRHLKNKAKKDDRFCKPLQFLLDFDVSEVFNRQKYLDCFKVKFPTNLLMTQPAIDYYLRRQSQGFTLDVI